MALTIPPWLADLFSVMVAVVAAICLGRIALARRRGRRCSYDGDAACALMGLVMLWMLQPSLSFRATWPLEVIFTLVALWFVLKTTRELAALNPARRRGRNHILHHVCHGVMAVAMVVMLSAGHSAAMEAGMSMSNGGPNPFAAFLLAGVLLGFCVWHLDSIWAITTRRWPATSDDGQVIVGQPAMLAPRLELGAYATMSSVMAFTLLLMR